MVQQTETPVPIITVDGPGGVGKGTLCMRLAKHLGWHLLDSGAIYRALALCIENAHVELDNLNEIINKTNKLNIEFKSNNEEVDAFLEGRLVSAELRSEPIGELASKLAAIPEVRRALLQRQRDFAQSPGLIADGRDMGSVVFPHAPLKIFLTASVEERAQRRYKQLKAKGCNVNLAQLLREIAARDSRDAQRSVAPLKATEDAHKIDTTHLSADEVFEIVLKLSEKKLGLAI